jgi:uncharacterized protein YjbI with pentapeptide repeats
MLRLPWAWSRPSDEGPDRRRGLGGAGRLPPLDLHGAFLRRVDLSDTNLQGANFAGTDFTDADLRGSDLMDANMKGAILRGADLREVANLAWEQLSEAVIDDSTRLPDYLKNSAPQCQFSTEG